MSVAAVGITMDLTIDAQVAESQMLLSGVSLRVSSVKRLGPLISDLQ